MGKVQGEFGKAVQVISIRTYRWKQDKFSIDGKEVWVSWIIYINGKQKYFIGIDAPYNAESNPEYFFAFLKGKYPTSPFLLSFDFQFTEDIKKMLDSLEVPVGGRPPYRATYQRMKIEA